MTFPWPRIDVREEDIPKLIEMMKLYDEVEKVEVRKEDDGTYTLVPVRKTN